MKVAILTDAPSFLSNTDTDIASIERRCARQPPNDQERDQAQQRRVLLHGRGRLGEAARASHIGRRQL